MGGQRPFVGHVLHGAVAQAARLFGQQFAADAGQGLLARGVDVRQHQHVGVNEALRELVEEIARARKQVRLENRDEAPVGKGVRGGFKRRGHLGRVVRVVVHDADAALFADNLKAPLDAPEAFEGAGDGGKRDVEFEADGDGGKGVAHVVDARHVQREGAQPIGPVENGEARRRAHGAHVLGAHVGLPRQPVRHQPPLDLADDGLHVGLVEAHDGGAEKGDAVGVLRKRLAQVVEVAVDVEVVGLQARDDGE